MKNRIIKNNHVTMDNTKRSLQTDKDASLKHAANDAEEKHKSMELEHKNRLEDIEMEAKKRAETMLREIDQKAEALYEKARKEGYGEGFEEGLASGKESGYEWVKNKKQELLSEANQIKEKAEADYRTMIVNSEEQIIRLVLETTKKLVHKELESDRELIVRIIEETINKTSNKSQITLKVSEEDFNVATNYRDAIIAKIDGIETLDIQHDETITPGSCMLETAYGNLHSNLNEKVEMIEKAFIEIAESSTALQGEKS